MHVLTPGGGIYLTRCSKIALPNPAVAGLHANRACQLAERLALDCVWMRHQSACAGRVEALAIQSLQTGRASH